MFEYDHIAPSGFGVADQEGTDSYVLFGSNMTYVWTGSPQMTLRVVYRRWFEYDPRRFPKGVELWFKYDQETPQWARQYANQVGIDSYVLFGSNTTYVWTGSPQMTIFLAARFEYDHKPDQPPSDHVKF